jgi:putative phosphoesterase
MRIAVVSDIHGNLPALEAVVADFQRRGVDAVVNLGDSLSGPLLPLETAQFLMSQDWAHLAGNHERQILDTRVDQSASDLYARSQLTEHELSWLRTLGPRADYADDVLLCHGTPDNDLHYLMETVEPDCFRMASAVELEKRLRGARAALIVCGHSHVPRSLRTAHDQLVVNPGSVGVPGYRATAPHPHLVQNGSPDARYAIVERRGGRWQSGLFAVPYDFRPMAALAAQRGRPEWERVLSTGYVGNG